MLFTVDADRLHRCVMVTGRPGRFGSAPGLFVGITFCHTEIATNQHTSSDFLIWFHSQLTMLVVCIAEDNYSDTEWLADSWINVITVINNGDVSWTSSMWTCHDNNTNNRKLTSLVQSCIYFLKNITPKNFFCLHAHASIRFMPHMCTSHFTDSITFNVQVYTSN